MSNPERRFMFSVHINEDNQYACTYAIVRVCVVGIVGIVVVFSPCLRVLDLFSIIFVYCA
jgi:hypothetical protein